ncbi:MFS transporter [Streptomyces stelliscabiei]|uniref:MFS transporter n=1 Tax=Streptomyces stelliscabiei TaxID=146820 RepID=UPI002FF3CDD8
MGGDATLLAAAVATPVVGRLGDMFGKRRMLLLSIVLLVSGSVVCALADSLVPMIIGRVCRGWRPPSSRSASASCGTSCPPSASPGSTALMSASLGVGGALGLPAAAFHRGQLGLATCSSGPPPRWAPCPSCGPLVVPESTVRTGGRFDLGSGRSGLSAGLVSLLLAVSKGGDWGWTSGTTLGLSPPRSSSSPRGPLRAKARQPLVDLRTTARPQVLFTNLASVALGLLDVRHVAGPAAAPPVPEQTGYGLGRSMMTVGLVLARRSGDDGHVRRVRRAHKAKGPKVTLMAGALIVAPGTG